MSTAHVSLCFSNILGITKRVLGQALAAHKLNLDLSFVIINPEIQKTEGNLIFQRIPFPPKNSSIFKAEVFRRLQFFERSTVLKRFSKVVLRYPGLPFASQKKLHEVGSKIITEHHTNETAELSSSRHLSHQFLALLESWSSPRLLKEVRGIIGVTDEIRRLELRKSGKKLSTVISNGISTEMTPFTRFVPFTGKHLKLVTIPSVDVPWHGLDRLIHGLSQYLGMCQIELNVVGVTGEKYHQACSKVKNPKIQLRFWPQKTGKELDFFMENATLAISTLGLFRKNMKEACSLKTREFFARGIPFVYAYNDPDFSGKSEFCLQLANENTPVDIEQLIDFAGKVSRNPDISHKMRDFARTKLDWEQKVQQMVNFTNRVLCPTTEST